MTDVNVSGQLIETMFVDVAAVNFSGIIVNVLRSSAVGDPAIQVAGMVVNVLRNTLTNPVYTTGLSADVMFTLSPSAQIAGIEVDAMYERTPEVQVGMVLVEVLMVPPPPSGAGKFNRQVTVIT